MAGVLALAALFTALFAAPLVLGTFVVTGGAGSLGKFLWFGFLTVLLLVAFVLGTAGLVVSFLT